MKVDAVVVAAGGSTRFGGRSKLLEPLCGTPVIAWTMLALAAAPSIERAVVVARKHEQSAIRDALETYGHELPVDYVAGGERRRDSVEAGLRAARSRYVAIHDGARPLVTPALVERVVAAAEGHPGAIAAAPVSDTVKEVGEGRIVGHPDRSMLWAAQTPQVVLRQAWLDAAAMSDDDETDDSAMLSRAGLECVVVESDATNLKITRPADIAVAAALLRESGRAP